MKYLRLKRYQIPSPTIDVKKKKKKIKEKERLKQHLYNPWCDKC